MSSAYKSCRKREHMQIAPHVPHVGSIMTPETPAKFDRQHSDLVYNKRRRSCLDENDPRSLGYLFWELDHGEYGSVTKQMEEICQRLSQFNRQLLLLPLGKELTPKKKVEDLVVVSDDESGEDMIEGQNDVENKAIIHTYQDASLSTENIGYETIMMDILGPPGGPLPLPQIFHMQGAESVQSSLKSPILDNLNQQSVGSTDIEISESDQNEKNEDAKKTEESEKMFSPDAIRSEWMTLDDCNASEEDEDHDGLWGDADKAFDECKMPDPKGNIADKREDACEHSYILEDDTGWVCKHCGLIKKSIDKIFEFQWLKGLNRKASFLDPQNFLSSSLVDRARDTKFSDPRETDHDMSIECELLIHPKHKTKLKPHQLEGFKFLQKNLLTDRPGGCILAHAPGTGKTMLMISFIESFMIKYPKARPCIVHPKSILETWRREFRKWGAEEIRLISMDDASSRPRQLEKLVEWKENKSILFIGYMKFSSIVSDVSRNEQTTACRDILLKVPGLLILDEGHTARNEETDVLQSLAQVQTPRKIVLSGTIFQNHVREVFNNVALLRPNFRKLDKFHTFEQEIRTCIRSKMTHKCQVEDLVEDVLKGDDPKEKTTVIKKLRKLTDSMLHYYKGDLLDNLPGLLDVTVILNLTSKQKDAMLGIDEGRNKFKTTCLESSLYLHPFLKEIRGKKEGRAKKVDRDALRRVIDEKIRRIDVEDGVKTKFFLSILSLAEATGEKLLVFSQFVLPLVFLERLVFHKKGWRLGKEVFEIVGDTKSEDRAKAEQKFNESPNAKIFFGSIKACGEGISLVGASRVLFLDVHINPSVTRQGVGRAFRPGQDKKVYAYRLVSAETQEEKDHVTSFQKELMSKMWFDWTESCDPQSFQMSEIDIDDCDDKFLQESSLKEDIRVLYKR